MRRALIGALLVLVTVASFAASCTRYRYSFEGRNGVIKTGSWQSSPAQACTEAAPAYSSEFSTSTKSGLFTVTETYTLTGTYNATTNVCKLDGNRVHKEDGGIYGVSQSSFEVHTAADIQSQVVANCDTCESGKTGNSNFTVAWSIDKPTPSNEGQRRFQGPVTVVAGTQQCVNGCVVQVGAPTDGWVSLTPSSNGLYRGSVDAATTQTGASCSASGGAADSTAPAPACTGTQGSVNGVPVCLPTSAPTAAEPGVSGTSPRTGNPPAGSDGTGAAGTRTPATGDGGNAGGPAGAGNGTRLTASGNGTGGTGGGGTGGTGNGGTGTTGDGEGDGTCDEEDPTVGCMKPGDLQETPLDNKNVPMRIERSDGFGPTTSTCPAPRTVTLMGRSYSFSWGAFCDLANGVRPIIIGLGWVTAAFAFIGLSRKGA